MVLYRFCLCSFYQDVELLFRSLAFHHYFSRFVYGMFYTIFFQKCYFHIGCIDRNLFLSLDIFLRLFYHKMVALSFLLSLHFFLFHLLFLLLILSLFLLLKYLVHTSYLSLILLPTTSWTSLSPSLNSYSFTSPSTSFFFQFFYFFFFLLKKETQNIKFFILFLII